MKLSSFVKAWIVLTTRCAAVPPKILEGYFEALYSVLVRPWPDILAIVFRVCFPVLGRDCGLIDDRIGIVGPFECIGLSIHDFLPMRPSKARQSVISPRIFVCQGLRDISILNGTYKPIVALGVNILLPRSLAQRCKPIGEKQQPFAESRVFRWEILNDDNT